MSFEKVIRDSISRILNNGENYSIKKNKKCGQSDTFTILNSEDRPILIAKFFDYLSDVKTVINSKFVNSFNSLDELLDHIDELDNIQLGIDQIVFNVLFQQRCYKRYINVCSIGGLDCFPELIDSIQEIVLNGSFYGFLLERYVDGITLEKKFPIEKNRGIYALDFLIQLGRIIKKLHENGIVHRDISPDNIIYLNGKYIVIDPGMVKFADDNVSTQSRMILGKKYYASPEQYFGQAKLVTFKSDLYATGIIAMEIVLGYNPLRKIIDNEKKYSSPHDDLLKKYNRELEDDFFDNVEEDEFHSRLLLIIQKMVQIDERYRYDSIDSFLVTVTSLEERCKQ